MVQKLILFGKNGQNLQEINNLNRVLTMAGSTETTIVLMEDGVLGIIGKNPLGKSLEEKQITIKFATEDLEARGFKADQVDSKYNPITYEDIIDLINSTPQVISWL